MIAPGRTYLTDEMVAKIDRVLGVADDLDEKPLVPTGGHA